MTAAFVPSRWPAAPAPSRGVGAAAGRGSAAGGLHFGREVLLNAAGPSPRALQWQIRRNCSITPHQMLGAYGLLCTVSLAVALSLWLTGAPMVLAFTGFELMLLGAAMLVFARHAGDGETLTLVGRALLVEQAVGPKVQRAAFNADWLTVEPAAGQNSLVELAGQGRTLRVGRFLRPELRADFARELRRALRPALPGAMNSAATIEPSPAAPSAPGETTDKD